MACANNPEGEGERFQLPANEVHVWLVNLSLFHAGIDELRGCLSEEERSRAEGFHFAVDRARFTISRALLRKLLGRYLSQSPGEIDFSFGPFGKPALPGPAANLHFNLAHTKRWAAYAFALGIEVGIDLEDLNREVDWEGIASRFFAEAEIAWIRAAGPADRAAAFFRCWTRKEAILKGIGKGLGFPLTGVDVISVHGKPVWTVESEPDGFARDWRIADCDCAPDCYGAIAVAGQGLVLRRAELLPSFF